MAKIVHFELPIDDPVRATAFYRDVLGWEVAQFGEAPYWLVTGGDPQAPGANGALVLRNETQAAPVLIAGVDDIDAALDRAVALGAALVQAKLPVPGVGWSAYVRDPEGNTLGLFQDDPAAAYPDAGPA